MSNARTLANTINSSSQIVVPSGGVNFGTSTDGSGTVTGGVLDDYEEGTWTPTITGGTVSGGSVSGSYTKVGRLVSLTAQFTAVTIVTGSVSGFSFITGFPFASSASSVGNMAHCTMTSIGQAYVGGGSTGVVLTPLNTTGVQNQWNEDSNLYMTFQITYDAS